MLHDLLGFLFLLRWEEGMELDEAEDLGGEGGWGKRGYCNQNILYENDMNS